MFLDYTLVLPLKVILQFTDFYRSGTIFFYHPPPWLLWERALEDISFFLDTEPFFQSDSFQDLLNLT